LLLPNTTSWQVCKQAHLDLVVENSILSEKEPVKRGHWRCKTLEYEAFRGHHALQTQYNYHPSAQLRVPHMICVTTICTMPSSLSHLAATH
jgi:hypothetical protein